MEYRACYQPCVEKEKLKCCSNVIRKLTDGLYALSFPRLQLASTAEKISLQIKDAMGTLSEEVELPLNVQHPCGSEMPSIKKFKVNMNKNGVRSAFVEFPENLSPSEKCAQLFKRKYQLHPKRKNM